jgi:hypothetical protein
VARLPTINHYGDESAPLCPAGLYIIRVSDVTAPFLPNSDDSDDSTRQITKFSTVTKRPSDEYCCYTHTRPIFTGYSGRYRSVRTHAALTGRSYDTGGCPIPSVPWHRSFVMCSRTRTSCQAYTHRGEPPRRDQLMLAQHDTKSVRLLFLSPYASGHKNEKEGGTQTKKRIYARIGYATGLPTQFFAQITWTVIHG